MYGSQRCKNGGRTRQPCWKARKHRPVAHRTKPENRVFPLSWLEFRSQTRYPPEFSANTIRCSKTEEFGNFRHFEKIVKNTGDVPSRSSSDLHILRYLGRIMGENPSFYRISQNNHIFCKIWGHSGVLTEIRGNLVKSGIQDFKSDCQLAGPGP